MKRPEQRTLPEGAMPERATAVEVLRPPAGDLPHPLDPRAHPPRNLTPPARPAVVPPPPSAPGAPPPPGPTMALLQEADRVEQSGRAGMLTIAQMLRRGARGLATEEEARAVLRALGYLDRQAERVLGLRVRRIVFGAELRYGPAAEWINETCNHCHVRQGAFHVGGCAFEECPDGDHVRRRDSRTCSTCHLAPE